MSFVSVGFVHRTRAAGIAALSFGFAVALPFASAAPPTYSSFELQARSNLLVNDNGYNLPPGSSFNSISADIDDTANVAFPVQLVPDAQDPNAYRPGIWYGGHGQGALVYTGPVDADIDSDLCLTHSAGGFAYIPFTLSTTGVGNSLYLYSQPGSGAGSAAPFNTAPAIPNSYSSACITVAGTMSFQANYSSGRAYVSYVGNGEDSVTQFIGDANVSPGSPYTYLYTPSSNDSGTIAAKVATSSDQFTNVEIRLFSAGASSTLILANQATDASSPYAKFDNSLALNNHGAITVVATRASDNRRVVVRSDGTDTVEIAAVDPAGTIRDIEFFAPAINDAGLVAFRARDANGQAIYVGDGTTLTRVIGDGDVVDTDLGVAQIGQDNASDPIFSGRPAINANGDIAFIAGLYPQGDNQTEWGSGVFVAYAGAGDVIFADGFDG